MTQQAVETAMGMRGYRGSPAEQEDHEQDIKLGGIVVWNVDGDPVAKITQVEVDDDGDPWFHLTFIDERPMDCDDPLSWRDGHKDVRVERNEIRPYKGHIQWGTKD